MRVAFATLGCKVNQAETEAMIELFLSKGYKIVEFEQIADVYIINTCTVTNSGDKKSRQIIRKAKSQNQNSIVVVVGCYAQTAKEEIEKIEGVNIIIGTKDRNKIVDIVSNYKKEEGIINHVENIMDTYKFEEFPLKQMKGRTRAYLKIQDGCNQFCSYCIIPYARGPIRSRQPEDILKEVKNLVDNGFKEIVLAGIHVASYGKDLKNIDLLKITKMVHNIEGLERLRFSSIEPNILTDNFLNELKNLNKVCTHMHLSLQSGCDKILKSMNRKYTTKEYLDSVLKLKENIKDIAITTDLIVGFPGETIEDFNETCEFIKKVGFSKIHVFPYSPKKGTKAYSMKEQISSEIKSERVKIILELENKMRMDFLNKNLNKVEDVLFEQLVKDKIYEGYTSNYIKVFVESNIDLKNKILPTKLTKIKNDSVNGEILFA